MDFSNLEEGELEGVICNINGMRFFQFDYPSISTDLREFLINGLNSGGITDLVERKPTGKYVYADPYPLLRPYLEKTNQEITRFDSKDPSVIVNKFLKSDQRIMAIKTKGHEWSLVKVLKDPSDPSKGVKAIILDQYYSKFNGKEWNERTNHKEPTMGYWIQPIKSNDSINNSNGGSNVDSTLLLY